MKKEKAFWNKEAPENHKTKHLTSNQKSAAKARAKANNRPYPNLIDNSAVARRSKSK